MLGCASFEIKTCMDSWLGASEMTKRWTKCVEICGLFLACD